MVHQKRKLPVKVSKVRFCYSLVALVLGASLLTVTSSPAWAQSDAPGAATCSFSATVKFSPPLTDAGGGTNRSSVRAVISGCTTTLDVTVKKGASS